MLIRELEDVVTRSKIEDDLNQGNSHTKLIERARQVRIEVRRIVTEVEEAAAAEADRAAKAAAEKAAEVEAEGWSLL